jgi:hypothetical protein
VNKEPTLRQLEFSELSQRRLLRAVRDSTTGEHEWEFHCECGEANCHEYVFLTLDAFITLRDHGDAVLADGHRVSQIVVARGLVDAAKALTAQADHQLKRAKKNLGHS